MLFVLVQIVLLLMVTAAGFAGVHGFFKTIYSSSYPPSIQAVVDVIAAIGFMGIGILLMLVVLLMRTAL